MSRYIDLDKLKVLRRGQSSPNTCDNKEYIKGWNAAIDILEKADVEDVVKKKYGWWDVWYRLGSPNKLFYCSECKHTVIVSECEPTYTFCPYCGSQNLRT